MFYFPVSTMVEGEIFYSHDAILSTETSRRLDVLGQGLMDCNYISPLRFISLLAVHFLHKHPTPTGRERELLHSYARQVFFWDYYLTKSTLRLLFIDDDGAVNRTVVPPVADDTNQLAQAHKVRKDRLTAYPPHGDEIYDTLCALWDHYATKLGVSQGQENEVIHITTSTALQVGGVDVINVG